MSKKIEGLEPMEEQEQQKEGVGDCAKKRTGLLRWFASLRPKTDPPSAATPIPIARPEPPCDGACDPHDGHVIPVNVRQNGQATALNYCYAAIRKAAESGALVEIL